MYCSKCGKEIKDNSKFCPFCGTKMETETQAFCPECGAELVKGAMFCAECGHKCK